MVLIGTKAGTDTVIRIMEKKTVLSINEIQKISSGTQVFSMKTIIWKDLPNQLVADLTELKKSQRSRSILAMVNHFVGVTVSIQPLF